mmetsp:Transcript_11423/g.17083  ORF Transcript_11423/g.17083 Transcript_11423/m.17083 type:complete len:214 (-) Transcript_11423:583-1224(-)
MSLVSLTFSGSGAGRFLLSGATFAVGSATCRFLLSLLSNCVAFRFLLSAVAFAWHIWTPPRPILTEVLFPLFPLLVLLMTIFPLDIFTERRLFWTTMPPLPMWTEAPGVTIFRPELKIPLGVITSPPDMTVSPVMISPPDIMVSPVMIFPPDITVFPTLTSPPEIEMPFFVCKADLNFLAPFFVVFLVELCGGVHVSLPFVSIKSIVTRRPVE